MVECMTVKKLIDLLGEHDPDMEVKAFADLVDDGDWKGVYEEVGVSLGRIDRDEILRVGDEDPESGRVVMKEVVVVFPRI